LHFCLWYNIVKKIAKRSKTEGTVFLIEVSASRNLCEQDWVCLGCEVYVIGDYWKELIESLSQDSSMRKSKQM
jgi:hypothetical protein